MNPPPQTFDFNVNSRPTYLSLQTREVWQYRDMLYFLVLRDFKIKFKQSFLGITWAVFRPLISMIVFSVVFGAMLKVEFPGPYSLFFLGGMIAWDYFAKVFTNSTTSLVNEADLLKKVYFPRIILPLAQAFSALTDLLISLLILFAILMPWHQWFHLQNLLWFPLFLVLNLMFSLSISLWLAILNVRFRDIQIMLPLLLQSLMMLSPVIYPSSSIQGTWRSLYALNPMVGIVDGFRYSLLGYGSLNLLDTVVALVVTLVLFAGGLAFFQYQQRKFADVI